MKCIQDSPSRQRSPNACSGNTVLKIVSKYNYYVIIYYVPQVSDI